MTDAEEAFQLAKPYLLAGDHEAADRVYLEHLARKARARDWAFMRALVAQMPTTPEEIAAHKKYHPEAYTSEPKTHEQQTKEQSNEPLNPNPVGDQRRRPPKYIAICGKSHARNPR